MDKALELCYVAHMTDFQNTLLWVATCCTALNVSVTLTCIVYDYIRARAARKMRAQVLEQLYGLAQSDLSTYIAVDDIDLKFDIDPDSKLN